jgi:hypothetical protein
VKLSVILPRIRGEGVKPTGPAHRARVSGWQIILNFPVRYILARSSTSTPSSGSPRSAADQVFADLGSLLSDARNGDPSGISSSEDQVLVSAEVGRPLPDRVNVYQSGLSSVAAMWPRADALAWKRFEALLSLEDGWMGVPKDTLMHDLLFANLSSPNL